MYFVIDSSTPVPKAWQEDITANVVAGKSVDPGAMHSPAGDNNTVYQCASFL